MKNYELTYLIPSNLSEIELKSLQEKINYFIVENKGNLGEIKETVKKKLEYPIKKQGIVYLTTLNFYLNPQELGNLEKTLKSENQIIHYMILTKKPEKIVKAPRRPLSKAREFLKPIEKPKKVELKEIEQKLEEILGE